MTGLCANTQACVHINEIICLPDSFSRHEEIFLRVGTCAEPWGAVNISFISSGVFYDEGVFKWNRNRTKPSTVYIEG